MGRRAAKGTRTAISLRIIVAGFCPNWSRWHLLGVGALLTGAMWIGTAAANAQGATGDIRGSAREQAAGPLAGVTIVATNQATGVKRTVQSGTDGLFAITSLPAGVYELVATLPGF